MGHFIAPLPGLRRAMRKSEKVAAGPEGIADVANGAFDAAFLIACADLARARLKVIVAAAGEDAWMKANVTAATFEHDAAEVVVKDRARLAAEEGEGAHMAAQEAFHRLIEEKLQIQSPGIGQRHDEAGERSFCASHLDLAEVSPVCLRLLAGKGMQAEEGFANMGAQSRHGAPQLHDAARVTTRPRSSGGCVWPVAADVAQVCRE